jgi:hypothetical protein
MDSNFVYKMEQVLETYEKKIDPLNPVICFDERPCQLIDDVLAPVPPTSKSVQKMVMDIVWLYYTILFLIILGSMYKVS